MGEIFSKEKTAPVETAARPQVVQTLDPKTVYIITDGTFAETIEAGTTWSPGKNTSYYLRPGNDYLMRHETPDGRQDIMFSQAGGAWSSKVVAPIAGGESTGTPTATFVTHPRNAWKQAPGTGGEQARLLGFQ